MSFTVPIKRAEGINAAWLGLLNNNLSQKEGKEKLILIIYIISIIDKNSQQGQGLSIILCNIF